MNYPYMQIETVAEGNLILKINCMIIFYIPNLFQGKTHNPSRLI